MLNTSFLREIQTFSLAMNIIRHSSQITQSARWPWLGSPHRLETMSIGNTVDRAGFCDETTMAVDYVRNRLSDEWHCSLQGLSLRHPSRPRERRYVGATTGGSMGVDFKNRFLAGACRDRSPFSSPAVSDMTHVITRSSILRCESRCRSQTRYFVCSCPARFF